MRSTTDSGRAPGRPKPACAPAGGRSEATWGLHSLDLEALARRRVGRKIGLYIHALVYVLVNLGLYAIQAATGEPRWSHFPLMGWGLGLAIHALVTFIALQGDGLRRSMLAREIDQLRRNERG